jgi:hypothetical protein
MPLKKGCRNFLRPEPHHQFNGGKTLFCFENITDLMAVMIMTVFPGMIMTVCHIKVCGMDVADPNSKFVEKSTFFQIFSGSIVKTDFFDYNGLFFAIERPVGVLLQ